MLSKKTKIATVFKKGDSKYLTNYRPVSLLSSLSKLLEKIMYKRLYNFLKWYNIFNVEQFRFRPGHPTSLGLPTFCFVIPGHLNTGASNLFKRGPFWLILAGQTNKTARFLSQNRSDLKTKQKKVLT